MFLLQKALIFCRTKLELHDPRFLHQTVFFNLTSKGKYFFDMRATYEAKENSMHLQIFIFLGLKVPVVLKKKSKWDSCIKLQEKITWTFRTRMIGWNWDTKYMSGDGCSGKGKFSVNYLWITLFLVKWTLIVTGVCSRQKQTMN